MLDLCGILEAAHESVWYYFWNNTCGVCDAKKMAKMEVHNDIGAWSKNRIRSKVF